VAIERVICWAIEPPKQAVNKALAANNNTIFFQYYQLFNILS
jgi:hypothetical protein